MMAVNGTENNKALVAKANFWANRAFLAEELEDTYTLFLCAADLYRDAGCEETAKWASEKADQCMRVLSLN